MEGRHILVELGGGFGKFRCKGEANAVARRRKNLKELIQKRHQNMNPRDCNFFQFNSIIAK